MGNPSSTLFLDIHLAFKPFFSLTDDFIDNMASSLAYFICLVNHYIQYNLMRCTHSIQIANETLARIITIISFSVLHSAQGFAHERIKYITASLIILESTTICLFCCFKITGNNFYHLEFL